MSQTKFGYQWEDPYFEEKCFRGDMKNILLIGSGGEMLFHLLAKFGDTLEKVDCIDFNKDQLELIEKKYDDIQSKCYRYYGSVFEDLLSKSLKDNQWDEHLSNENLIKNFSERSVKFTNESFSEHYKKVLTSMDKKSRYYYLLKYKVYNNLPDYYAYFETIERNWHKVHLVNTDIFNMLKDSEYNYDFMSLSNVSDWLEISEYDLLINLVTNKLNINGKVVLRRLLSNNEIKETEHLKIEPIEYKDDTNLYSQTVCLQKNNNKQINQII
jgi:S-adenosylmethionine:diacylglycerol 3-amino-3-carboxypropyl transferase